MNLEKAHRDRIADLIVTALVVLRELHRDDLRRVKWWHRGWLLGETEGIAFFLLKSEKIVVRSTRDSSLPDSIYTTDELPNHYLDTVEDHLRKFCV